MPTGSVARPNGHLHLDWKHTDGAAHVRDTDAYDPVEGVVKVAMLRWDTDTLAWVKYTGGGGGGAASSVEVTNFPASQAVTAAALPLPAGASTSAKQDTGNASLASIDTKTPALSSGRVPVDGSGVTQPISHANLDAALSTRASETTLAAVNTAFGAKADAAWDGAAASPSAVSIWKYLGAKLEAVRALLAGTLGVAVSNFPASQAVTGPLTDAQLRATAVPVTANAGTNLNTSLLALETTQVAMSAKLPATLGQKAMAASMSVVLASDQPTVPVSFAAAAALFKGRACTFRTPGRAGAAGQKILSVYNASGSPVKVVVNKMFVDLACTVVKAITVLPPVIRCWKVAVLPTNGTALAKTKIGGSSTSNAAVTVLGDASADGTGSVTTLTATLPVGTFITQEFAPRFITGAGYEMADRVEFFGEEEVELGAGEGLVLFVDYTAATQNPITDMWIAGVEWRETT